ncbi:MAG: hypothetical protein EOS77_17780 [Mesorhizobium sp.]|nr:MAG: hypothetical protein EOS77_17780 [Mesorhizobium sp.]
MRSCQAPGEDSEIGDGQAVHLDEKAPPQSPRQPRSKGKWPPVPGGLVRLLVLIPPGHAKVRLDSWYVSSGLFQLDGREVDRANGQQVLFGENWQF